MSATNEFSKLDHRVPLARAEVARVGSGWNDPAGRVDRADPASYLPLTLPGGNSPPPQQAEPAPPPPTEEQLRAGLAQCIVARDFTAAQLARAEATVDRAVAHVARCRANVADFGDLEAQITAATVEALRSGEGRPRGGTDDELRQRIAARDVARASLTAVERAEVVLREALVDAQTDATQAAQAARRAAIAVAAIEATKLAERVVELESEAERTRAVLLAFDRVNANSGHPLPAVVFGVVVSDAAKLMQPVDASSWYGAVDALMADAEAAVSIPLPPRRPKPVLSHSHEVTIAIPIRRPQPDPVEED